MTRLTRDLLAVSACIAFIVGSLLAVRLTSSEISPAATEAATEPTITATFIPAAPEAPSSTGANSAAAGSTATPPSSPRALTGPTAAVVLSSGDPVVPRVDPSPRTFRPAVDPPTNASVTSPAEEPNAETFNNPADVAAAWLNALCWYDYRDSADTNLRRAANYGDIHLPPGQDPFTLDDRAWVRITSEQLSSACTGITATVESVARGTNPAQMIARIDATQILSTAGQPFQAVPVAVTRHVGIDEHGRWMIGPPEIAN